MNCDHGRETVVRTGEATSLGRKADRIALTGEVRGFPRLNQRPYGRGHGAQEHGDSGGDGRGVSDSRSATSKLATSGCREESAIPLDQTAVVRRSIGMSLSVPFALATCDKPRRLSSAPSSLRFTKSRDAFSCPRSWPTARPAAERPVRKRPWQTCLWSFVPSTPSLPRLTATDGDR